MKIYVLFDKVSHQFAPVFQQATDDACRRAILKDENLMKQIDDFKISCFAEIQSLETIENVPDDLDFSSVLRVVKSVRFVSLKEFIGTNDADVSN